MLPPARCIVGWTTTGTLAAAPAIATIAFFLFLFSAIGGWRAVIYVTAALSALILVLMIQRAGFPNADDSPVRRAFQEVAVNALR